LCAAESECWKKRKNSEIYERYNEYDDVKFIKLLDLDGLDM